MPTSAEILEKAREAIGKGDVAAARELLKEKASDATAVAAPAATPEPPPEPRKFEEIMLDFVKGVHRLLGNSPALVPIVNELAQSVNESTPSSMTPKE